VKGFNLSEWAVTHRPLTLFFIILVSLAGAWSYLHLGRAEDPDFTVKHMILSAAWPGATADEVQRLVADPIEKKLQEVPYFDKVKTYSRPGSVVMQLSLVDATPPSEVKECWYQARKRVGDIKANLPAGVLGPFFNDEFGDVDSVLYVLTGQSVTMRELKDEAEILRQALLRVPSVTKVRFYGEQTECIFIELNHAKLATLGLTAQTVFNSIAKQNEVTPAGELETATDTVYLRVDGALKGTGPWPKCRSRAAARCFAWEISPPSTGGPRTRRPSWPATKANPVSPWAWSWPRAAISWSWGTTWTRPWRASRLTCRWGSRSTAWPINRRSWPTPCSNSSGPSWKPWSSC